MIRNIALAVLLALPGMATAQEGEAPPKPCSTEEFRQFDFWLGDWDLTWQGGSGTNSITAPLGDCVIQESFSGDMGNGNVFSGMSVSTYDPKSDQWKQTWVDNAGSYLVFTGGMDGDRMILRGGNEQTQTRMIFDDIKEDSLLWHWEASTDGGKTWQSRWIINYKRRTE